jgi:hypothetical protein
MAQKANKVKAFWTACYGAAGASGIPEKTVEWGVNRAQKFVILIMDKKTQTPFL